MRTYSLVLLGMDHVKQVVLRLIARSQWFELEPHPDDEWEIKVKEENRELIHKLDDPYPSKDWTPEEILEREG